MAGESSAIPRPSCLHAPGIPSCRLTWMRAWRTFRPLVRCRDHQPHAAAGVQPRHLLLEAGRVGKQVVVGFPNFGHWQIRFGLSHRAHAKVRHASYEWYDTPTSTC